MPRPTDGLDVGELADEWKSIRGGSGVSGRPADGGE
jgi:hypothetical protein